MSETDTAKRINAARAYAGLSLEALSEKLGISVPTLRRWGEPANTATWTDYQTDERVRAILRETGCPPEFFGLVEDGEDYKKLERSPGFQSRLRRIEEAQVRAGERLDQLEHWLGEMKECECGGDCGCGK